MAINKQEKENIEEKDEILETQDNNKNKEPLEKKDTKLDEINALKKQLDEEKDRYLRLNAEFDNFRKRTLKEKEEFVKYSNEKLILDFIDILESLERGIENANTDNKTKLIEGMKLVYKQFKNVLDKNGLVPIISVGEQFDPFKHEAMMQTITDEYEEDTILEEFARGYLLNGKVIRYSKVRVSKTKEENS